MKERVAALVGPTAVGKTEISLQLAERLDAEIVSVDSMQIYRDMDIGTAKATAEEQRRVRHHLLDLREPEHPLTVVEFQSEARAAIADIHGRGRLPLLVGGSGLYFRAVVDDLNFPPRAQEVRDALEEEAERIGVEALHERLHTLDPEAASRIEPGNVRRTIRALEVIEITGRQFSENDSWERYESRYHLAVAGLSRPREELYERVAARVDRMIAEGFVEEARALEERLGLTARRALGYKQILDAPGAPLQEMRDEIVRATKRFARRQESWFRADPRIRWFDASAYDLAGSLQSFFEETVHRS